MADSTDTVEVLVEGAGMHRSGEKKKTDPLDADGPFSPMSRLQHIQHLSGGF